MSFQTSLYSAISALASAIMFITSCCLSTVQAETLVEGTAPDPGLSPVELTLATNIEADDHAPMTLMGDHTHKQGEWMVSYRYMYMYMDGLKDEGQKISDEAVLSRYRVTPLRMHTHMHMLGAMFAPHDKLTLTAMVPYINKLMSHRTRVGQEFNTRSNGIGDIQLNGLVPLLETKHHKIIGKMGVNFPTGSIDQRDNTPAAKRTKLPYPMQLGSGTYDLLPGLTYRGEAGAYSWGVQGGGVIRLGRNDNQYRLGNRVYVTPWAARQWTPWLSTSIRANAQTWGRIIGADPDLNPRMVPTASTYNQSGKRVDLAFGVNLAKTKGFLRNHRLAFEMGFPIYQHLDGPQMRARFFVTGGWQWTVN